MSDYTEEVREIDRLIVKCKAKLEQLEAVRYALTGEVWQGRFGYQPDGEPIDDGAVALHPVDEWDQMGR